MPCSLFLSRSWQWTQTVNTISSNHILSNTLQSRAEGWCRSEYRFKILKSRRTRAALTAPCDALRSTEWRIDSSLRVRLAEFVLLKRDQRVAGIMCEINLKIKVSFCFSLPHNCLFEHVQFNIAIRNKNKLLMDNDKADRPCAVKSRAEGHSATWAPALLHSHLLQSYIHPSHSAVP